MNEQEYKVLAMWHIRERDNWEKFSADQKEMRSTLVARGYLRPDLTKMAEAMLKAFR